MVCEGLTYMGPALVHNSPADAHTQRVELDLEITAGSYNAKVNLPGVLQLAATMLK